MKDISFGTASAEGRGRDEKEVGLEGARVGRKVGVDVRRGVIQIFDSPAGAPYAGPSGIE